MAGLSACLGRYVLDVVDVWDVDILYIFNILYIPYIAVYSGMASRWASM